MKMFGYIFDYFYGFLFELISPILNVIPERFGRITGIPKIGVSKRKHPIVLLHGYGTSNVIYSILKKRLEGIGFRVYVPDLGGYDKDIRIVSRNLEKFISERKIKEFIMSRCFLKTTPLKNLLWIFDGHQEQSS